ncbi:MAG: hypothetical protein JJU10_06110 [Idiomarina sp.]|nr:hypothetical protein [Idiomarina sp.]
MSNGPQSTVKRDLWWLAVLFIAVFIVGAIQLWLEAPAYVFHLLVIPLFLAFILRGVRQGKARHEKDVAQVAADLSGRYEVVVGSSPRMLKRGVYTLVLATIVMLFCFSLLFKDSAYFEVILLAWLGIMAVSFMLCVLWFNRASLKGHQLSFSGPFHKLKTLNLEHVVSLKRERKWTDILNGDLKGSVLKIRCIEHAERTPAETPTIVELSLHLAPSAAREKLYSHLMSERQISANA